MAGLTAAVSSPEALFPQQRTPPPAPAPAEQAEEATALPLAMPDEAGDPAAQFLSAAEMATFRRVADLILPRTRTPGALDAGAPEFLDFLVARSGPEKQKVYRDGLARLDAESRRRFGGAFADVPTSDAEKLLDPLRQPWTPAVPADPPAAFLRDAKDDLWRATVSSREWAAATTGRRRAGAGGAYWYPVE